MSRYGIELRNDRNFVVADPDNLNFVLRSAGRINNSEFSEGNAQNPVSWVFMDLSGFSCPLIFIKSSNAEQRVATVPGCADFLPSGYALQKYFIVAKWWNKNVGDLQYYVYDRWIPPGRSKYGIQMFDQGGNITFDSGWDFLKLRRVLWMDPGYPNHQNDASGSEWTNIGSAGPGNLALSMPVPRAYDSRGFRLYECFHLDAANNVFVSLVGYGVYLWGGPNPGWAHNMRSQVMVADVSGQPVTLNPVPIY
ncbi:hypothetical protein GKA92_24580 [Salmonella enterica subsp. enterica]|nr:hypothetical protein [Salmonella enterica subsp. enterica serovar Abaetetuba]